MSNVEKVKKTKPKNVVESTHDVSERMCNNHLTNDFTRFRMTFMNLPPFTQLLC